MTRATHGRSANAWRRGARSALATLVALTVGGQFLGGPALAGVEGSPYAAAGRCGPFPRAAVRTPPGLCVGIAAGPSQGLLWPRNILEVSPGRFVIADAAGWAARGRGRILAMTLAPDGTARFAPLIEGRSLPHGLAKGPDGFIYVGDDTEIWRFDPKAAKPVPETVLDGLPGKTSRGGDHWHPLKQLVFDREGRLLVSFGAPNDSCAAIPGVLETNYPFPCPFAEGEKPDASIWRLTLDAKTGKVTKTEVPARGLRNAMALAVHPESGTILEAENNVDRFAGRLAPDVPPEEFNIIREGAHYGWPYCAGTAPLPEYARRVACETYAAPYALLPAHGAPLALAYYAGAMFPDLAGKLIVALHSDHDNGHRLLAYPVDQQGRPQVPATLGYRAPAKALIDDWTYQRGVKPTGRPSGITIAHDGAIWIVDDKARAILVLRRATEPGRPAAPEAANVAASEPGPPPKAWAALYGDVLQPRCSRCHSAFRTPNAAIAWRELANKGHITPEALAGSPVLNVIVGESGLRPMPPGGASEADKAAVRAFLAAPRD